MVTSLYFVWWWWLVFVVNAQDLLGGGGGLYGDLSKNERIGWQPFLELQQALNVKSLDDLDEFEQQEAEREERKPLWKQWKPHMLVSQPKFVPNNNKNASQRPLFQSGGAFNKGLWQAPAIDIASLHYPSLKNKTIPSAQSFSVGAQPLLTSPAANQQQLPLHFNFKKFIRSQYPLRHPPPNARFSPGTEVGCFRATYRNRTTKRMDQVFPFVVTHNGFTFRFVNPQTCMNACAVKGYKYAGLFDARQCRCGKRIPKTRSLSPRACGKQCRVSNRVDERPPPGCGGDNAVRVYASMRFVIAEYARSGSTTDDEANRPRPTHEYRDIGCFLAKNGEHRDLDVYVDVFQRLSLDTCRQACTHLDTADYEYSGVTNGTCWCGTKWPLLPKRPPSDCTFMCGADLSIRQCGGSSTIRISRLPLRPPLTPNVTMIPHTNTSAPVAAGCFLLNSTLEEAIVVPKDVTPLRCRRACVRLRRKYAWVNAQCRCSNLAPTAPVNSSYCGMPCPGNRHLHKCGGKQTAYVNVVPLKLVNTSTEVGAHAAPNPSRRERRRLQPRVYDSDCYSFPVPGSVSGWRRVPMIHGVTPSLCIKACRNVPQTVVAGVEEGKRCWCGNDKPHTRKLDDALCKSPCSGNHSIHECGGFGTMRVFFHFRHLF